VAEEAEEEENQLRSSVKCLFSITPLPGGRHGECGEIAPHQSHLGADPRVHAAVRFGAGAGAGTAATAGAADNVDTTAAADPGGIRVVGARGNDAERGEEARERRSVPHRARRARRNQPVDGLNVEAQCEIECKD